MADSFDELMAQFDAPEEITEEQALSLMDRAVSKSFEQTGLVVKWVLVAEVSHSDDSRSLETAYRRVHPWDVTGMLSHAETDIIENFPEE